MSLVLPYVYLMLINISFIIIFKRKFCFIAPLSLVFMSLVIMITGYIGDLRIGIYTNISIVFIAAFLVIFKKRKISEIASIDNAIVFAIYSIFFLYIGFYYKYGHFTWFDDFGHWGPMVKGMAQYNKLYSYLPINNAHPDYPPLVQCFEYLWCYLAGGYSEPSVFRAMAIFTFSLFLPIFDLFKNKTIKMKLFYSLLTATLIMILNTISYKYLSSYLISIYLDFTIATCSGITIFLIIMFNKFDYLDIISKTIIMMYLLSLILLKEIGIAFYFMALFVIVMITKYKNKKQALLDLLLYVILPVIIFVSWKLYTKDIVGQFSMGKISVLNAINALLFNKGTDFVLSIKGNYLKALFTKPILNGVNFSFVLLCVVFFVILVILTKLLYKKDYKKIIVINLTYILGVLGYIFTMYALYISCFNTGEAITLASYERYFAIYIHFSIVLLMLLSIMLVSIKSLKLNIIVAAIFFVSILVNGRIELMFNRPKEGNRSNKYMQMAEQVKNISEKGDEKLLILTYDDLLTTTLLKYDNLNNRNIYNFNLFEYDGEYVFKDKNELINIYKNFDYVYVYESGEELWKAWKETNNDDLYNNRLYKVEGNKLVLIPWSDPLD